MEANALLTSCSLLHSTSSIRSVLTAIGEVDGCWAEGLKRNIQKYHLSPSQCLDRNVKGFLESLLHWVFDNKTF